MNTLIESFQKKSNSCKFIPYISLGDPEFALSIEWAKALLDGGADILELGIPFSDPIADGPVIQKSYKRALEKGFSMKKVFQTTKAIHQYKKEIPLIYLTYLNPVMSYGLENFFKEAKESGITGIVIPDLPYDTKDTLEVYEIAKKNNISIIYLVTPASTKERILSIKKFASGFVYYITSYGVTGERSNFAKDLNKKIAHVKKILSIPVCAGFGISNAKTAKEFSSFSDGVIIGSAIQKIIQDQGMYVDKCVKSLYEFSNEISNSVHHS